MNRISPEKALEFLREYVGEHAPDWLEPMVQHAEIVRELSVFLGKRLSKRHRINLEALEIGAILHDIGRVRARRVVEHGVVGAEILRRHGFPEEIARIAETHVGVGITREEAERLGLPLGNYIPETLEERTVCYSDNLVFFDRKTKKHRVKDASAVVERFRRELGPAHAERAERFMQDYEALLSGEELRKFRDFVEELNRRL